MRKAATRGLYKIRLRQSDFGGNGVDTDGAKVTFQIVAEDEASIRDGRISISSPIARGLIGKYAGDAVEVQTPGGLKRYEILDVRYE